jgi:uncharacterized membrane protein
VAGKTEAPTPAMVNREELNTPASGCTGMIVAAFLSGTGLIVSVIAYRKQRSAALQSDCSTAQCESVFATPHAELVAGMPNSVAGILWYSLLLIWSLSMLFMTPPAWLATVMTLGAAAALAISFYLAGILIFTIRQSCPLCYTAHAINAAILALLLLS